MRDSTFLEDLEPFEDEVELLEVIEEEVVESLVKPLPVDTDGCVSSKWLEQKNHLGILLVLLDSQLNIRWRNNAFRAFRETEGLEYNGRPFHALFTSFSDRESREKMISSLNNPDTGYGWKGRVIGRGKKNRKFVSEINIIPLEYSTGMKPDWYLAVISDVTESIKDVVRRNFDSILKASLLKDEDTGTHVERVNAYSRTIAEKLKGQLQWTYFIEKSDESLLVDNDFIEDIGILAAFHDVGKIGTPETILLKNGKLNEEEWKVMREHPINGALILDAHPSQMVKHIAKSHHERWDGSGYPYGLKGAIIEPNDFGIPLSARIVAIADVYDALRTRRPYKEPFSEEKTFSIITSETGSHFDPGLIEVFKESRETFAGIYDSLPD